MKSPAILSVSKKFYADILTRVSVALSFSPSSVEEAMRIINAYLSGRLVGTDNQSAMIAFNMIKPEIDRAMLRSQRARERARSRREMKTQNETTAPAEKPSNVPSLSLRCRRSWPNRPVFVFHVVNAGLPDVTAHPERRNGGRLSDAQSL